MPATRTLIACQTFALIAGIFFSLAVLAAVPAFAEPPVKPPAKPTASLAPEWNARFAGKDGWIGGDAIYSVKISDKRIAWFFGDTFVGTVKNGRRDGAAMVNNSVGILSGSGSDAKMTFHFGKKPNGKPGSFFTPPREPGFEWPLSGAMSGTKLVQTLVRIEATQSGGPFGFKMMDQSLVVIENPGEDPAAWKYSFVPLPFTTGNEKRERLWGSACVTVSDMTYIYGTEDRTRKLGTRQLLVARVPTSQMSDPKAWRFRSAEGWSPNAEDAVGLANGLATELSVTPAPGGGYVAVYTENGIGDRIVGRFSTEPDGPWSAPRLLYSCPEKANSNIFTYAAKAHGWHDRPGELLISYSTNGWKFATSIESDEVYRPRFITWTNIPSK
ncbi:MAG: DUF4185 domain-containing protein [Gemmataceae bacterium]